MNIINANSVIEHGEREIAASKKVASGIDFYAERCKALDDALDDRLAEVKDLATLVRRFIHATRHDEGTLRVRDIRQTAAAYLKRKGLQGSPLRGE